MGRWSAKRPLRSLALVMALFGASVVLAVGPAAPALAHDVLEATDPADGSVLTQVPSAVHLTFDHTPLALGSEILVKDQSGTNQSDGPVSIVDNHVTQNIKSGAPAGKFTVVWRIVSSDSHPIEGTFTFTAGTSNASAAATSAGATSASATASTTTAQSPQFPWGLAVGAVVVLAGLIAVGAYVRRRLRTEAND
ncbi:copper resistance protein CopC [Arthrobacter sp. efr-133-TYG-104]|uniref:copper resistance CopC family protein n=1 Tax=Arthrobacter sp. efr-133-TYG-104 TaxID=3040324 RepID=UPI00254F8289|nr:copper resistance protein CopC [Arthrobacter sp. efr-133-TYG-104]